MPFLKLALSFVSLIIIFYFFFIEKINLLSDEYKNYKGEIRKRTLFKTILFLSSCILLVVLSILITVK